MTKHADDLLVRPRIPRDAHGIVHRVTPTEAAWELLTFEVRRFAAGASWTHDTGDCEAVLVLLGGRCAVHSSRGDWPEIGRRAHVFDGLPWALYLPRATSFTLTARTDGLELAHAWVPTDQAHPPQLITPEQVRPELRGGGNNSRQINDILPAGADCHRLVCCEVYTPGGNWSSYPPHKHDAHRIAADGTLLEADLEEVYYYKMAKPNGFAVQRIYTDDRSTDALVLAQQDDLVLVPFGYHPVSAAYGYDCYYLNVLAGSAQSLAASDDPDHSWVKDTWDAPDPRLPMVVE